MFPKFSHPQIMFTEHVKFLLLNILNFLLAIGKVRLQGLLDALLEIILFSNVSTGNNHALLGEEI